VGVVYPELPEIRWSADRYLIGLSGAIGSGKSAAGRSFAACGALVADADQIAREVLHSAQLREALLEQFGPGIFDAQTGEVLRAEIAARVFGQPERLARLNALVHPAVGRRFRELRDGLAEGAVLVYDIPLLFETEQAGQFDLTIVVSAPADLRFERVHRRDGWSRDDFDRREASQLPLSEKEKRADLVLRNTGSGAELEQAVQAVYRAIQAAR
jgi:dephospho-CoA kinase